MVKAIEWPGLDRFRLNSEELDRRRSFIGGSDANIILSGDREKVKQLWHEKRGECAASDLSDHLPVMLGCWTEAFNRQWFEWLSGERLTSLGAEFACPKHGWRRCTVDGVIESSGAVWEAKHTNAFAKSDELVDRYMPQLQHNMAVAGRERAVLSVIVGNHKFEVFEVAADWLYQLELLAAEQQFWSCVSSGAEPVVAEPPPAPRPIGTREICFEGNNAWSSAAFDWLQYRQAAKAHASATSLIKSLVEDDVGRAFGHGVEAKRSKSGAITIREFAQ